jgi:hypothetical protein
MSILAYTYEADVHCPDCTAHAWAAIRLPGSPGAPLDEHALPADMTDWEGNPVHPVFNTAEQLSPLFCSDCGEEIK